MSTFPQVYRPKIWTPPDIKGWGRQFLELFTAGKRQRNSSGKAVRNPHTGKTKYNTATNTNCGCNCGCLCGVCSGGEVPCDAQVNASGIDWHAWDGHSVNCDNFAANYSPSTVCGPKFCGPDNVFNVLQNTSVINPNGTYDIGGPAQYGSPTPYSCEDSSVFCQWNKPGFASWFKPSFGLPFPVSTPQGLGPDDIGFGSFNFGTAPELYWNWVLRKTSAKWALGFVAQYESTAEGGNTTCPSNVVPLTTWFTLYKFYGELSTTSTADCSLPLTFTNELLGPSSVVGCPHFTGAFDEHGTINCSQCSDEPVTIEGIGLSQGGTATVTFA